MAKNQLPGLENPPPVPLRRCDGDHLGVAYRVGSSRVSLDTVIHEFNDGADPEGIVSAYPTVELADVYAVIAYYLRHKGAVEEYLRKREAEAAELRQEIEGARAQIERGEFLSEKDVRRELDRPSTWPEVHHGG